MKTLPLILIVIICNCCNYPDNLHPAKKIKTLPVITGSWNLLIWKGVDQQGRIHYPYDKNVKGFASFDVNNNYSMQYYNASRPLLNNNDPFYCSDAEIRIAFLSANSSFGKYSLKADSVYLTVENSLIPNLNSSLKKNYYEIHGDTLLMVTGDQVFSGVRMNVYSIWLRK